MAKNDADPKKPRRWIRENIDSFAIAILMAVLMKYFVIEAYQIPTSSMQPTMMGSKSAGVFDRIIVDKIRPEMGMLGFEPKRWDIAVFRYPIRYKQNYVKRVVGMPGDRLRIAGGNIYRVVGEDAGNPDHLEVVPRPDDVLNVHWKQIYPARMEVGGASNPIPSAFQSLGGKWTGDSLDVISVKPRTKTSRAQITYIHEGGAVNRVDDGYLPWIARAMRDAKEQELGGLPLEGVQDIRVSATVTPTGTAKSFWMSIEVTQGGGRKLDFRLQADGGKARLVVNDGGKEAAAGEPFDLPLTGATEVAFAHVDDTCRVWIDGDEMPALSCNDFKTTSPLIKEGGSGTVTVRVGIQGVDQAEFRDLTIDRDLHYLPTTRSSAGVRVHEVPEDHFMMMGDNTQQSVDSRDWTSITIGMQDGRLVNPKTHPDCKVLKGNLRAFGISEPLDPDENPVIVYDENKIVFTDHLGEVWVLDGRIAEDVQQGKVYGRGSVWFEGDGIAWEPEQDNVPYVRREHIIGRPVLNFWPLFDPFRFGFIK